MFQRRIPEWLRHAHTPSVRGFALLAGVEAAARGMLISVFPIAMYRAFGDAAVVSEVYFVVGLISLTSGLMVPWLTRFIPRRWVYSFGALLFIIGALLATVGGQTTTALALAATSAAVVTMFVCFNAYVLDFVARSQLGRCETLRMFYSALAWTTGPALGVWLLEVWAPAPFLVSAFAACCLITVFWVMRLGNGKLITKARAPAPNPLAYLPRFLAQPRLVAGFIFAVVRSCGWWVYVVYLPIYAVQNGLDERLGGVVLSISNGCLFLTPLMLRLVQRHSVRRAVRTGFLVSGSCFALAWLSAAIPSQTIGLLMVGSAFLVLLDITAGLPFLMAVKPSERTEMSAIYSSYRDVSGIVTPGIAWLVLLVAPLAGVFAAAGGGLLVAWAIAGRLHPRLGRAPEERLEPAVKEAV
ncbi:MAG: MFS transporter [Alphaproteobacteria bacterium]|nr:MFS transporter [Alphaproteobacteria bacterium]